MAFALKPGKSHGRVYCWRWQIGGGQDDGVEDHRGNRRQLIASACNEKVTVVYNWRHRFMETSEVCYHSSRDVSPMPAHIPPPYPPLLTETIGQRFPSSLGDESLLPRSWDELYIFFAVSE